MFKRDKATSPSETSMWGENVFFPGRTATKQLVERDVGAGCSSANPMG